MAKKTAAKVQASDFVHLHNHTHHSLLDGLQKIGPMLDAIKEMGMTAAAITDHGTLSGVIEFYKAARDRGIKPIIGIETYVANRKHTDKDPQKDKSRFHLLLFAMNDQGYRNLMKLSTIANLDGYYYKPRIDRDLLEKYSEGLIVTSGCIGGEVADALRQGDIETASQAIEWYKSVFGDRYYLELQDHGHIWEEQKLVNDKLLELGAKYSVPCLITGDAHYTRKEDQEAHEILLCVQTGSLLNEPNRFSLKNIDLGLKDPVDILERWSDHPELIANTKELADRCNLEIELGNILIPKFSVPKGKTEKTFLDELTYQGLTRRYGGLSREDSRKVSIQEAKKLLEPSIKERAEYELGIIADMGFSGYFLIVQDFINWGKEQGIVFGPGRGSAAGSIIAYALNITDLDPLEYDLLFERFLNPDRISMPDIDIDIQDSRRDEVINYCIDKYGEDKVANIVTFGTMAARNAIRDVSRVLDIPYAEADRLAKMVPPPVQGRHILLSQSIKEDPDLKAEYESNPSSKRIMDLAIRLEGTIRSHGVHAAGVVIAPDDLVKFTPLEMSQKGVIATQYPMGPIEDIGLLKVDFLGLSNLTIINNAIRIVRKVYGTEINIDNIPIDDKKTYELLSRGDTTGVFQVESAGMKRVLKELQPTVFEDIIATVAMYRPGPMQFIDNFIERKHGRRKIEYLHPKMEASLKTTYGVLLYQEQVMEIAKEMCGFTGGQADTLRKAIGKKIATLLNKMKAEFIEGGVKHSGATPEIMEVFWKQLEDFAAYCFNKSHAACYGLIAYWTAYLKAHFPAAFMAALMTSDFDDTDRLSIEISECKAMGLEVLPPDVNESFAEFAVITADESKAKSTKATKIRYGMTAIKNVGASAVEEIIRIRKSGGPFTGIEDFAKRVSTRVVNRKAWESLIKAGAFDNLEPRRDSLLLSLDTILAYGSKYQKEIASGQTDLFDGTAKEIMMPTVDIQHPPVEVSDKEKLQWEKELLGVYLSSHPLEDFETYLSEQTMPIQKLSGNMDNRKAVIGGSVLAVREIMTKKGSKMAFATLADKTGEIELVVFPDIYGEDPDIWQPDNILQVTGTISGQDRNGKNTNEPKVLVKEASRLTEDMIKDYKSTGKKRALPKTSSKASGYVPLLVGEPPVTGGDSQTPRLYIHLVEPDDDEKLLKLKSILDESPGKTEVIVVTDRESRQAIRLPFRVEADERTIMAVSKLFGDTRVVLK